MTRSDYTYWMKLSHHVVLSWPRSFSGMSCHGMLLQFHARTRSGQACGREVGVHFSFQDQVSDNHAVRNWTFDFLPNQASDNHAVRNWTYEVATTNQFSVQAHVLTIMQSGI